MNLEYWKEIKKQKKMTIAEIAEKANLPKGSVQNIFAGYVPAPRIDTVEAIEKALGIKNAPVLEDEVELNDRYLIPLLGSVVAGVPIESQQNLEGCVYVSYRPANEYFALRVHGDSMKNAGIFDKSVLICHKQEYADSGDIVVAMLNGEQTVKRYRVHDNDVYLMPENPDYFPIPVKPMDELLILGKVVETRVIL